MEHDDRVVRPLMRMRVSRDSGRTWSPVREVWPDDCNVDPSGSIIWPPCLCPRHRKGSETN